MINDSIDSINSTSNQSSTEKFTQRLPSQTNLISIECPISIPPNQSIKTSHSRIIEKLGGQKSLNQKLELKNPNHPIELQLGSTKLSSTLLHPIPGEWISTNNILIKIIKRKRKSKIGNEIERVYKIEAVGMISDTVRFRHMSDFQYIPDPQHPISKLSQDMKNLNPEGVLKFRFANETEDYSTSDKIGLFPPPIFSRYMIPSLYQYKAHVGSVLSEKNGKPERLINKSRYICSTPQAITFENPNVPQGPLPEHLKMKKPTLEALYQKALRLFEERPVWSRPAFQNQLTISECRALRHDKHLLAYTCYMFADGAFRDLLVKFGYDPRVDPNARFYQRISIRNLDDKKLSEKFTFKLMRHPFSKQNEREEGEKDVINRKTHIFDGIELNHSVGTYQLIDIKDPLLKRLIESTKGLQTKCRIRNGWYTSNAIEQIRSILRRKFFNLLNEGDPSISKGKKRLVDLDFVDLLEIDVGIDSIEVLKKPKSVGEMKYGGKNVKFDGKIGKVILEDDDDDELQEDREDGSNRGTKIGYKPFKSKPKNRIKARVNTGLSDEGLEMHEEMEKMGSEMEIDDDSQMVQGSSSTNKIILDQDEDVDENDRVEMLMKHISVDDDDEEDEDDEDGMYDDDDDESNLTELEEEEEEEEEEEIIEEEEENEEDESFESEED